MLKYQLSPTLKKHIFEKALNEREAIAASKVIQGLLPELTPPVEESVSSK